MKIKTLYTGCLRSDAIDMLIQIIERMGWAHDEPDEFGDILVKVPTDDEHLFNFIDNCICQ